MAEILQLHDEEAVNAPAFSEEALALLFAEQHGGTLRYVAAWGKWLHYDGAKWQFDDTRRVFSLARNICREAARKANKQSEAKAVASAKTRAAVVSLAGEDRRLAATVNQWDVDPWLLNTPDGVVELRSGKMRPHAATDYMTKITAVAADGACPKFRKFLQRVFDKDTALVEYVQRMLGYSLTGVTTEHALFFCHGNGGNGKGVLFNTARGIFGDYHETAAMSTFVATDREHHPTDLAKLRGARLVTSTETEEGARWAETKIKTLTGGDEISARFMRQDFFNFVPQFKLAISGNHKPVLRSVNEAIRRRMNLIPFVITIPEKERDPILTDKLKNEWPGILKWMIEGCLEWQRIGLKPPQVVIDATKEYLDSEDNVGNFIEERCTVNANAEVNTTRLFNSWQNWANANNAYVGAAKNFNTWMAERGFIKGRDKKTNTERVFKGLELRASEVRKQ
jgi:putative DNA primase/helicase